MECEREEGWRCWEKVLRVWVARRTENRGIRRCGNKVSLLGRVDQSGWVKPVDEERDIGVLMSKDLKF